jgi:hypothetical protein
MTAHSRAASVMKLLKEFERFLNKKLNTGKQPVYMVFLPVTRDEGIKRLADWSRRHCCRKHSDHS